MVRSCNLGIDLLLRVGVFVLVLSSATLTDGLSVEDRLQQLTEDLANYKVGMKEILTVKDARLEELELKVNRLEETVQQQDLLIKELKDEKTANQFIPNHLALTDRRPMGKAVAFPRTCRELRANDPSLNSGMYWVDPDGQSVGDDPIQVYCDMAKGSTAIVHDSESPIDVGHCADPGCYSRPVNYNATMKQITALAELSGECHQSIQYDCNYAPFQFDGVAYSWWNDRNGTARYFWAGANSSVHTCQCGIENNCLETARTCNCDSAAPIPLTDSGVITDKSFLPITRLNFGRTQLASSSGVHTLGRLECSGQFAVTGMPKSCADLWQIGHSLSGLHSVMGVEQVETVYCDFSKLPTDSGFQKWIGFNDVKSQPVYFYVQRNYTFNTKDTPIPFEFARLNIGNAMNLTSGIFTAPRAGTYHFAFAGRIYIPASSSRLNFYIEIYANGKSIGHGYADEASNDNQYESLPLHSTLKLQAGDRIWLQIYQMALGTYLFDNGNHYTHFSGWLLEENISKSLNVE